MKNYFYKCSACNKKFSSPEIEDNLVYLCPGCGKAETNKPLEGVLTIEYDYDEISREYNSELFQKLSPGSFWNYSKLFPLNIDYRDVKIETLLQKFILPSNPIQTINFEGNEILIFDDTRNPTLSYKDRASVLVVLKAIELGIDVISTASTGNAGSSLAGICAKAGLKSKIFVPRSIPKSKLIQLQSYGAEIFLVDGSYDEAFDLCVEVSNYHRWYNRNTAYNPLTIEGKKSAAFDTYISLNRNLPEIIFVPVGDGVIISGLYKGFLELLKLDLIDRIPKLIAVQAEGSDALARFNSTGKFVFQEAHSIADSICAGAPRNLYMADRAVRESGGKVITVSDDQILKSQELISKQFGYLVEPSCVASFAGYRKYFDEETHLKENAMLMLTGNGLKDFESLTKWNTEPDAESPEEWKNILLKSDK
ncbi:MAG: pyridoxal-phosphate dependent enzyme [Melioribacteraceae bacterium]|nr:pyridoxal-phosphate dependent enzyme [Melioribacteraceae bacterium]MCF8394402.1 pyridoxal-phosphate dependent enzyme [Melioribacteraceae bacterium]MCF8417502.1 pyridoxal-phosphate dependent enzyme [Melioribacteraceae bacterium]